MLLLPQNLTGKLQLYGFVSRLFISVNLFLFHRRLAKLSHLLKYLYLWLKRTYQKDSFGWKSSEKNF